MNHDREQHLPQTNTQEKLLHSGNFEGKLQEDHYDKENAFSVQEFKDLDTDQLQQVVPAPETSGALILTDEERSSREFQEKTDYYKQKSVETETGWQPTGSESLTETVETKRKKRGLLITIGAGAVAAAVALTTYFSTQSGDKDQNGPTPTQPVATAEATAANTEPAKNTAEAEPVVDKLPVDVIESGLFESLSPEKKAEIKTLRAMTVEQFREQPLEQQLMFAQFVYDNNAPRTLHAMKEEGFDLEAYANRVVEPSETNTAQQVVDSAAIMIDVAGNLYNDKGEYDVDTARKMVILSVEPSTLAFEGYDKDLQTRATGLATSTTTEISASKLYTTEKDTHMKVNLISKTGISAQTTYQLLDFKDTSGKDRSTWRWELSIGASDPRYDNTLK